MLNPGSAWNFISVQMWSDRCHILPAHGWIYKDQRELFLDVGITRGLKESTLEAELSSTLSAENVDQK